MPKLFSTSSMKFLRQIERPEKDLNRFICDNWAALFPKFTFIKSEFPIKGNVRSIGTGGKIDILAYNPETKKFIVLELKKDFERNITDQAADYRDYIQENFSEIYLHSIQSYGAKLPNFADISTSSVEIMLIAKRFSVTQIERVKKAKDNTTTLIKYEKPGLSPLPSIHDALIRKI